MTRKKDYIGYHIGCLTVVEELETTKSGRRFLCKCSICGGEHTRYLDNLKKSGTCGHKFEQPSYKRIYAAWRSMKKRCYLVTSPNYKHYGGRGIKVCDEWLNPDTFYNWAMNNGYQDDLSLDRIDPNGNYEPTNCRWASWRTQENNKRSNKRIAYNGTTKTMAEWARHFNISYTVLKSRLLSGLSFEEAISKPNRAIGKFTIDGETNTARYFAKKYGVPVPTVYAKLKRGLNIKEALGI